MLRPHYLVEEFAAITGVDIKIIRVPSTAAAGAAADTGGT